MKLTGRAFITVVAFILILPTILLVLGSIRTDTDLTALPPHIIPQGFTLEQLARLLSYPMGRWLFNSVFVAVASQLLALLVVTTSGYAFARKPIPFKEKIFWAMLASIMLPSTVLFVPTFVMAKHLGLLNNYAGLILPYSLSISMTFFYRQYIEAMPEAFFDLARLDGMGEIGLFSRIALPLSSSAIATIALLGMLSAWSSFMWPNAILFSPDLFTLPVGINRIIYSEAMRVSKSIYEVDFGLTMAAAVFMLFPMLVIFTAFHKYFAKGLWGGLK